MGDLGISLHIIIVFITESKYPIFYSILYFWCYSDITYFSQNQFSGEQKYYSMKSTSPWIDLFIWAILQNRDEMATYFWEMVSKLWLNL